MLRENNLFNNNLLLILEKLLVVAINFVTTIAIARFLGTEKFGTLGYVVAFVSLSYPIARLGMAGIITKELVEDIDAAASIIGTTLFLRFSSAGLLLLAYCVFIMYYKSWNDIETIGITFLLVASAFSSIQVVNYAFEASQYNKPVVQARILSAVVSGLIKLLFLIKHAPLEYFVVWLAGEMLLTSLFQLIQYIRFVGSPFNWSVDFKLGLTLLKKSWWLILSGLASIIYLRIDQVMIGEMIGHSSLGIYTISVKFSEIWFIFPAAIVTAIFPKIIKERQRSISVESYQQTIVHLFFILALLAMTIMILTLLTSWFIIPLLLGENYEGSIVILNIQILALVFVFMRSLVSRWILIEDLYSYSLLSHGVGVILNVILNFFLIPVYAGIGAAIATLISYVVASYLVFFISPKTKNIAILMTQALVLLFKPVRWKSIFIEIKKWA